MPYTWYEMGWIVLIYSCLGWCSEVAFAAVRRGRFVNRGFLNGPVCPIYGFGMLLVLLALEPAKEKLALLFFGSMALTSALEFLVGFLLERLFHDKWWDYSQNPFNVKGYICLEFSLIWGLACVLAVDVIHPLIQRGIDGIPLPAGQWLELGLFALLLADMGMTLYELLKLPKHFRAIEELEKAMTAVSDAVGEKLIYEPVERGRERREAFDERHPELAEKSRAYARELLEKRSEINTQVKQREDAGRQALADRRAELEKRLAALRANRTARRIVRAFPDLAQGSNRGRYFKRLGEPEKQEERKEDIA
ncbi:MAG: hypothetical protein IJ594_03400 [Oscillospiraceae bacterium]|nr:hypothetical protein [Oscillospiraceae bacterium]